MKLWIEEARASKVPIPKDTTKPGLEGTGPSIDLGMAFGALNSGASQWMWDWEDAGGDYKAQLYQGWTHLKQILAREWEIVETARDGIGQHAPLGSGRDSSDLAEDQRRALETILRSTSFITLFRAIRDEH